MAEENCNAKKWGPYVSDRQWGTVREDYSSNGEAWDFITHDMARSKAYRWGEEGIGGISDDQQNLCMALALWNGQDPILKERFYGLTGSEGNHGEDVKELYYYLDNTPDHTYQKMLYKYPMQAFPYQWLLEENRRRSRKEAEFELIDTGIFDNNRYFDVVIEYVKNGDEDILAQYTIYNRSSETAQLHLLPTFWFRNTMDWAGDNRPSISVVEKQTLKLSCKSLGDYYCYADGDAVFLFTDNETNNQRLYNSPNKSLYVKDGINNYLVNGNEAAVNPQQIGTKAAVHYQLTIPAGTAAVVKLRLANTQLDKPFANFSSIVAKQLKTADAFYNSIQKNRPDDEKSVQRQAWAGMLWSKQYYYYNVSQWRNGDPGQPIPTEGHRSSRNTDWQHLRAADVISMPDKWEYPWFAAWDLAFHCIAFAAIDTGFAKQQLLLLTEDRFMHPNGQLPAYEWNFSDVNPPIHALSAWKVYQKDKTNNGGKGDRKFLQRMLHKLMLNFNWWANKKDSEGNNMFEGGFLGLDNIGIFDRSASIPGGGILEQSDGTSWMAMYALNLTKIAVELSQDNDVYEDIAIKFSQHFFYIAGSMANMGNKDGLGLWDNEDGFYYDMLRLPNGDKVRLRFRTIVGLIPLFACESISDEDWSRLKKLSSAMDSFLKARPDLGALVSNWQGTGENNKHLLSLLRGHRMKCLLKRMLDESEFLSDYGIRSISKNYGDNPFEYMIEGQNYTMKYAPAESDITMFGGNSNWRGPIWMPLNYLLVDSLHVYYNYYGDDFKVEYPTHSGNYFTIQDIADKLAQRLKNIFLKNASGKRPVYDNPKLLMDEHFSNNLLFHEYFNGDTGKGIGASHQTGWTGLISVIGEI